MDTPETVDPRRPVGCFGREASNYAKQLLDGQDVELEKDVSETDRFGRLLRYVYLPDGSLLNALLLRDGYADRKPYTGSWLRGKWMPPTVSAPRPLGELLTARQRFIVLNTLALCLFVSSLDTSIVATATPRILADVGGFRLLSWIFTAYLLATTISVTVVGKLSDMFGRKPFLMAGVVTFVLASAGCGAAPSMPFLIVARSVQGIGGGIITGCAFAAVGDLYPPLQRAKYISYVFAILTIASVTGPAIGGLLTDGPGWRWCFYINVPIGAAATMLIKAYLPLTRQGGKLSNIDFVGAALLSMATVVLILALAWGTDEFGWASAKTAGLFVAAAALGVAFLVQERRHPEAIVPLFVFRNRVFVHANLILLVSGAGMFSAIRYLPTFIQTALGASATVSGLVSTPQSIGLLITSVAGGQVVSRTGRYKYPIILGACGTVVAAYLLQRVTVGVPEWHIAAFMVLAGLGSGPAMTTMSAITLSAVPQEFAGVATSVRMFSLQIAQVLGVALFGLVFTTSYSSAFSADGSVQQARAVVPPAVFKQFDDPTLALDARRFAGVSDQVRRLPDGETMLDRTVSAQKEAVVVATDHLFFGSTLAALMLVVLAVTMKEIPLRATFSSEEPASDQVTTLQAMSD